jgi:acetyltransferase-like isoleucine patch superfamily enzyme
MGKNENNAKEAVRDYSFKRLFKKLLIDLVTRTGLINGKTRAILLGKIGLNIDNPNSCYIGRDVLIDDLYPQNITIGEKTYITSGTKILAHYLDPNRAELFIIQGKSIIGKNVFIGMNSLLVKPVSIGDNAVIGAGSVVTRDVPSNAIVAGNPAKIIKYRGL